jgi:hypothetical protein
MHRPALSVVLLLGMLAVGLAPRAGAQRAPADVGPVTLRGVVVDAETGAGLPRMRLDVLMGGKRAAGTLTADDGTFSVAVTAPDRISIASFANLSLRTFKAGYASITTSYGPDQVRAPAGVRLVVPRAGAISGRLVASPGILNPVSIVFVRRAGDGTTLNQNVFTVRPNQVIFSTVPDEDGNFRVGGLPAGRYIVDSPIVIAESPGGVQTASAGGARMASAVVDVVAGAEVTGVDLVFETVLDGPPAPTEPAGGSLIRGRVTTTDGVAVGEATVSARSGGRSWSAPTDALGQFTLRDLPAGSFTVVATRRGYLRGEHGQRGANLPGLPVVVEKGKDVGGVNIMLSRGAAISGIVVDEHNEPLPDVSIQLSRVRQSATGLAVIQASAGGRTTDDRGMFRIAYVLPADYLLTAMLPSEITTSVAGTRTAYAPAFYPDTSDVAGAAALRLAAGDLVSGVVLTIRRVPVARVTGVAVNSQGAPFSGTLRLAHRDTGSLVLPPRVAEPDPSGAFVFGEVSPGEYVVRASVSSGPDGPEAAERSVTVVDVDPEPMVIRTSPSSSVSGHFVLDAPVGEMLWGYSIRTLAANATSSGGGMTNLGSPTSNGETFSISALSGPTRIVVSTDDDDWYLRSVTINGADVTDLPFDFGFDGRRYTGAEVVFSRFGASVTGRATDDRAAPVSDYAVYVFPVDRDKWFNGSRWLKLVRSATDGTFRVPSLPPGDYMMAAVDRVDLTSSGGDLLDADLLESLVSRATRATLGEGQSHTVTLRLIRR